MFKRENDASNTAHTQYIFTFLIGDFHLKNLQDCKDRLGNIRIKATTETLIWHFNTRKVAQYLFMQSLGFCLLILVLCLVQFTDYLGPTKFTIIWDFSCSCYVYHLRTSLWTLFKLSRKTRRHFNLCLNFSVH